VKRNSYEDRKRLASIIKGTDDWKFTTVTENKKALQALKIFYNEMLQYKPDRKYQNGGNHYWYMKELFDMKKGTEQKCYNIVCKELYSLLLKPGIGSMFFQKRVFETVKQILSELIKE